MLGTRKIRHAIALALTAALALGACGGDDDDAATDAGTDAADGGGSDEGDAGDSDGATDDELVDPPAGGSTNGEPVDTCLLLAPADISEATGIEFDLGTAGTPQGSLLGECSFEPVEFTGEGVSLVSVSARPASEYDGTVDASGNATPLDGFSVDANATDAGVMLNYPDFMVVVLAVGASGIDNEAAEAIARAIDERQAG